MGIFSLSLLLLGLFVIFLTYIRIDNKSLKHHIVFSAVTISFLVFFLAVHHYFQGTCELLVGGSLTDVKELILSWGIAAPLLSVILMIIQAALAPIPAFIITTANGLVFGKIWGTIISIIGATLGALFSFFISRLFYDNFSKKIIKNRKTKDYIDSISDKYGFRIILIARLIPFISFDFVSYAAGLSKIKTGSFVLASIMGMLPATIIYTMFGAEMEKIKQLSSKMFIISIVIIVVLLIFWGINDSLKQQRNKS